MTVTTVGIRDQSTQNVALIRTTQVAITSSTDDNHPNHVVMQAPREHWLSGSASFTDTADHALIAATGDANFPFATLATLQVINEHATQNTTLTIKDGSGGATLGYAYAQASNGHQYTFDPPLKASSGHGIYIAATTGTTTIKVSGQGFKSNV